MASSQQQNEGDISSLLENIDDSDLCDTDSGEEDCVTRVIVRSVKMNQNQRSDATVDIVLINKQRKTNTQCMKCKKPICHEHNIDVCQKCV